MEKEKETKKKGRKRRGKKKVNVGVVSAFNLSGTRDAHSLCARLCTSMCVCVITRICERKNRVAVK